MSATSVAFRKTPLDSWIASKVSPGSNVLSREAIAQYQLNRLKETFAWVSERSPFYSQHLAGCSAEAFGSIRDIKQLPFTAPGNVISNPGSFLCVSQGEIERVVTLASSGTSGDPKRLFFTSEDLELALDFFQHGVSAVAAPGEGMLIALPGEREGSVGYQLAKGIARAGVIPVLHGVVLDPTKTLAVMEEQKVSSIIGLPVQILSLAYHAKAQGSRAFNNLRSIVLCSDHVSTSLMHTLHQLSSGEIFQHYGMTEMGLGGGIDCEAHAGYHLRESDFYFEIVDVNTGEPLPDGEEGEIVFTTLTRRGMPLIRYRTGDISRFLPEPCPCGSILKRLDRVRNRVDSDVLLGSCERITVSMLDEALLGVEEVRDFHASLHRSNRCRLDLLLYASRNETDTPLLSHVIEALDSIEPIRNARKRHELELLINLTHNPLPLSAAKRRIEVHES